MFSKQNLRTIINAVLVTDSDLEAYCSDHAPDVYARFTNTMDRIAKVTLLMQLCEAGEIIEWLRAYNHTRFSRFSRHIPEVGDAKDIHTEDSECHAHVTEYERDGYDFRTALLRVFGRAWGRNLGLDGTCLPEPMRSQPDFIIGYCCSTYNHFALIKIVARDIPPFVEGGEYSAELSQAMQNLGRSRTWLTENHSHFILAVEMALLGYKHFPEKSTGVFSDDKQRSRYFTDFLRLDLPVYFSPKIVIGTRSLLNKEDNGRRAIIFNTTGIEIVTHDRLQSSLTQVHHDKIYGTEA